MPQTPQWTEFPKYPVIVGVGLLATAVTLAWWAGADISPLFASGYIRRGQFWRLFTTIFPHLNILHLAFNLVSIGLRRNRASLGGRRKMVQREIE